MSKPSSATWAIPLRWRKPAGASGRSTTLPEPTGSGLRHIRELWNTNVEGTENLLRSAAAAGVERVVHLSSGGVLKKNIVTGPVSPLIDENDFPAKAPRFCSYKSSKWHAEQRVLAWVRRGLPVVIASTTCPIGRGDETPTPTGQIIRDFLQRRFPFYCRTGLNFIGVGDLSRGLQLAAESGQAGERYLLSGENLWLKEFLDLLARETGLPAPRMGLPNRVDSPDRLRRRSGRFPESPQHERPRLPGDLFGTL